MSVYSLLCMPPATTKHSAVTYAASSLARNATALAISSGVPNLRSMVAASRFALSSGDSTRAAAKCVGTYPATLRLSVMGG